MSGTGTGDIVRQENGDAYSDQTVPEAETAEDDRTCNNSQKKRKRKRKLNKVDWTPELHRRFAEAVEELGVDKAVPSRILQIMGINCLTRPNIASHLQKYRSNRKYMLTRDAEAATWHQRRQMYAAGGSSAGYKTDKREMPAPSGLLPAIGFPPPPPLIRHFRPLHVWGYPTVDHAMMHMWPQNLISPQTLATMPNPSYCHYPINPNFHRFAVPTTVPTLYIPYHHQLYRPDHKLPIRPKRLKLDLHPSKESIDATIGDVLSNPWLPLPLGLRPPSVESLLLQLKSEGIGKCFASIKVSSSSLQNNQSFTN